MVRRPNLRKLRKLLGSRALPWVLFVAVTVGMVAWQNSENATGRDVLCRYANRIAAGARLDREFLVVLTTRPGLPPDKTRDAIIRAYLDFGPKAYPVLDCADVRAGRNPPKLPPVPQSPLAAVTSTTVP